MTVKNTGIVAWLAVAAIALMSTGCGGSAGDSEGDGDGDGDRNGSDGDGTGRTGGGGLDCEAACQMGQAGNCTSITGDCGSFCDALDSKTAEAGCTSQRSAYSACQNDGDSVCINSCEAQEQALTDCFVAFCAANLSDPDCQTLAGSFGAGV